MTFSRKTKKTATIRCLSAMTLLTVTASCGKTANNQQQLLEQISRSDRLSVRGANGTAGLTKTSVADREALFRGLIAKEAQERIAEDKRLNDRLDAFEAELKSFKEKVDTQFDKVDKRDNALRLELNNKFTELEAIDKNAAQQLTSMRSLLDTKSKSLEERIASTKTELETQLSDKINALDSRINKLDEDTTKKISELSAKDAEMGKLLAETQANVKSNSANASSAVAALEEKLAKKESEICASLGKVRQDFNTNAESLAKAMDSFKEQIETQMKAKEAAFNLQMQASSRDLRSELESQKAANLAKFAKIDESFVKQKEQLNSQINASVKSLRGELENLVKNTDVSTRTSLNSLINDLEKKSAENLKETREAIIERLSGQSADMQIRAAQLVSNLESVRSEGEKQLSELDQRLQGKLKGLEDLVKKDTNEIRTSAAEQLSQLRNELAAVQSNVLKTLSGGLSELEGRQTTALNSYKMEQIAKLADLTADGKKSKDALAVLSTEFSSFKATQEQVLEAMAAAFDSNLNGLESKLSKETRGAVEILRAEMKKKAEDHSLKLAAINGEIGEASRSLQKDIEQKYFQLSGKVEGLSGTSKAQFDQITGRYLQIEKNLAEQKAQISMQIASVNSELQANKVEYDKQIAAAQVEQRLALEQQKLANENEIRTLQAQLESVTQAQSSARTKLEEELKNKLAESGVSASAEISSLKGQLDEMDKKTHVTFDALKDKLADERVRTELSIASAAQAIQEKALAETQAVAAQVQALSQAQEEFKMFVAKNYATKGELEAVALRVKGLEDVTQILQSKIDENDKSAKSLLSAKILQERDLLAKRISDVEASSEDVKNKLGQAVQLFAEQMQSLKGKISEEISAARMDMKTQDSAFIAKLDDSVAAQKQMNVDLLSKVKMQSADFQLMSQSVKKELSDKLVALESKAGNNNSELEAARVAIQTQFADAVKQEQALRDQIASELGKFKNDLEKTADISNQALAMAQEAANDAKLLKADFETQKNAVAEKFKLQGDRIKKLDTAMKDMKEDFKKRLEDVSNQAAKLVENLGKDVQQQFSKTATDIALISAKSKDINDSFERYVSETKASDTAVGNFSKNIGAPQKALVSDMVSTLKSLSDTRIEFTRVLAPRPAPLDENGKRGEKVEWWDKQFDSITIKCGGRTDTGFNNAFGRDSFDFLADEYVANLLMAARGTLADNIFFGQAPATDGASLHHFVVLESLRNLEGGSDEPGCMGSVKSWANGVLYGNSADAVALRRKLAASTELKRAAVVLSQSVANMKTNAKNVEDVIKAAIAKVPNPENLLRVGQDGTGGSLMARYAATLVDAADNAFDAADRQAEFNKVLDVQNEFAKSNSALKANLETVKGELQKSLDTFKTQTANQVASLQNEDENMKKSLGKALDVLMSLAIRSGQSDLTAAALDAGKSIGYVPKEIPQLQPKILDIQHFFDSPAISSTNACRATSVLRADGSKFWKQAGNCCPWSEANNCIGWAGAFARSNNIWFKVTGAGEKFRIRGSFCDKGVGSYCDKTFTFSKSVAETAGSTIAGNSSEGVFTFRMDNVLEPYIRRSLRWDGEEITLTSSRKDDSGAVSDSYMVRIYSPLILDFVNVGVPSLLAQTESSVKFDLDGDGRKERTGWTKGEGQVGLLAIDLNNNGLIDSGRELFGEATLMRGTAKSARDGYAALAQYDENHDGVIDNKDKIYPQLTVWFDKNHDGLTDPGELQSLSSSGVTRISVKARVLKSEGRFVNGNELRTTAQFWGPSQCGQEGCKSYDVYFGTAFRAAKKK